MKVLVTGGAGFIGSHIAEAYANAGNEVVVVDNLSTGKIENLPTGVRFIEMDITSGALDALMDEERFDIVNHHAAHMELRVSVEKPIQDAQVNVMGSLRLLHNAYKTNVSHIVLASTCAVLGVLHDFPADETHVAHPISPYGCSKLAMENYAEYFRVVHGMSITTLRYTNVYGPKQNPNGESGVIAIFLQKFMDGNMAIIHGKGNQLRDYIHVADVVRANVAVTERRLTGTYFVCSGREDSVTDVVQQIIDSLSIPVNVVNGPAKLGDPARILCSPDKLNAELGWSAEIALARGIRETVDWFLNKRAN